MVYMSQCPICLRPLDPDEWPAPPPERGELERPGRHSFQRDQSPWTPAPFLLDAARRARRHDQRHVAALATAASWR